jgi:hypothetical protein
MKYFPSASSASSAGIGLALVVIAATWPAAQAPAKPAATVPFKIEAVTSPAGMNTEAPQLTVEGDRAILTWMESHGEHAVMKFAERTSSGWSSAHEVVSGTDLIVNAADVPSVRALPGGSLVAAWSVKNGSDPEASHLRIAQSKDNGRTWSAAVSPYTDRSETQHAFPALFPLASGFGIAWLDGREMAKGKGSMTLRTAKVGADGKAADEVLMDARVCDCCPTSAAMTTDGPVVAFRDRSQDEIRDIAVSRYSGGRWSAPALVHRDGWRITGCPVNGPSIAAAGNTVAVGWFTVQKGAGRAFVAFSSDAGRTFGEPIRVDDDLAIGRVQIGVLKDGSAAVSWIESLKAGSQLRLRRIERNGARSAAVPVGDSLGSTHPRLVQARGELLLAWVEFTRGTTRIRTARAALPK